MTTPAEFAGMAGAAVVGSMGTATWEYARDRVLSLFRRHAPEETETVLERLDGYEQTVGAAPEPVRSTLSQAAAQDVAQLLTIVAGRSDEAAEAVRALPEEIREVPAGGIAQHRTTFRNVKAKRDAILGGRDVNINKGEK